MRSRLTAFSACLLLPSDNRAAFTVGTERWRVKTLTDTTVGNIDPDEFSRTVNGSEPVMVTL